MKSLYYLFLGIFLFSACNKGRRIADDPCKTPINQISFGFNISDNNNDDLFSQQYLGKFPRDCVQIYHNDKYGITHRDSIGIEKLTEVPAGQNIYGIYSNDVLNRSLSGIKTFWFKRNFNVVDTVHFDERKIDCTYKVYEFKYNNLDLINNTNSTNGYNVKVLQ